MQVAQHWLATTMPLRGELAQVMLPVKAACTTEADRAKVHGLTTGLMEKETRWACASDISDIDRVLQVRAKTHCSH